MIIVWPCHRIRAEGYELGPRVHPRLPSTKLRHTRHLAFYGNQLSLVPRQSYEPMVVIALQNCDPRIVGSLAPYLL